MIQIGHHAQVGYLADAAEHKGKAADPKPQHTHDIYHHVHEHGMGRIFGPGKASLHQGESQLHEHNQVAGNQGPNHINGDTVMADSVGDFSQQRLACLFSRHILNGARGRAGSIRGDGWLWCRSIRGPGQQGRQYQHDRHECQ